MHSRQGPFSNYSFIAIQYSLHSFFYQINFAFERLDINGSIDATIIGGPTIPNGFGDRLKNALSITSSNASDVTTMQTNRMKKTKVLFRDPNGNELPQEVMNTLCRFRLKQKRGTIDVWWLYDDGGLSMLLPHILTTRANWGNSKIRVFCLAGNQEEQVNKETRFVNSSFVTKFIDMMK